MWNKTSFLVFFNLGFLILLSHYKFHHYSSHWFVKINVFIWRKHVCFKNFYKCLTSNLKIHLARASQNYFFIFGFTREWMWQPHSRRYTKQFRNPEKSEPNKPFSVEVKIKLLGVDGQMENWTTAAISVTSQLSVRIYGLSRQQQKMNKDRDWQRGGEGK